MVGTDPNWLNSFWINDDVDSINDSTICIVSSFILFESWKQNEWLDNVTLSIVIGSSLIAII